MNVFCRGQRPVRESPRPIIRSWIYIVTILLRVPRSPVDYYYYYLIIVRFTVCVCVFFSLGFSNLRDDNPSSFRQHFILFPCCRCHRDNIQYTRPEQDYSLPVPPKLLLYNILYRELIFYKIHRSFKNLPSIAFRSWYSTFYIILRSFINLNTCFVLRYQTRLSSCVIFLFQSNIVFSSRL